MELSHAEGIWNYLMIDESNPADHSNLVLEDIMKKLITLAKLFWILLTK